MSEQYGVGVEKILNDHTVILRVIVNFPETMQEWFPDEDYRMALMFLHDAEGDNLLGEAIHWSSLWNEKWSQQYSRGYVTKMKVLDYDYVPPEDWDEEEEKFRPEALIEIQVTDPAWISHLEPDMGWSSDAQTGYCDECEPILFKENEAEGPLDPRSPEGFIYAPRALQNAPFGKLSSYSMVPRFGEDFYDIVEEFPVSELTPQVLKGLVGSPVFFRDMIGILDAVEDDGSIWLKQISEGSESESHYYQTEIRTLGRAGFLAKRERRPDALTIADESGFTTTVVVDLQVEADGVQAELSLQTPNKGATFQNQADVLALLVSPLLDESEQLMQGAARLGDALLREEQTSHLKTLLEQVAKDYIISFSVSGPAFEEPPEPGQKFEDYYTSSVLPVGKLSLKVTDPAWLEHLEDSLPFLRKEFASS